MFNQTVMDLNLNFLRKHKLVIQKAPSFHFKFKSEITINLLNKWISLSRQTVAEFLDLTLLKDPIYDNIIVGMALTFFADLTFFTLEPMFLHKNNLSQVSYIFAYCFFTHDRKLCTIFYVQVWSRCFSSSLTKGIAAEHTQKCITYKLKSQVHATVGTRTVSIEKHTFFHWATFALMVFGSVKYIII